MAIYVVTGGANGIGKATVSALREQNHTVYVIDNEGGDIVADLGTRAGRELAIRRVSQLCPDGLDGLACIAGIAYPHPDNRSVVSVNYYGTVAMCNGLFELLKMRNGSCVVTVSGSILWQGGECRDNLAEAIVSCDDEERVGRLVNGLRAEDGYLMYGSTKVALLRWMRRNSVEWGARGVRLNAIGPGCVDTRLGKKPADTSHPHNESFHMTIPTHYNDLSTMSPDELGQFFAFMLSSRASGANGTAVWVDAGQGAYYNTERSY